MSTPAVPKRPSRSDKEITKQVAAKLLPDFIQWMKTDDDTYQQDDLLADLIKALDYADDGYEIAHNLDHTGYCPNAELVGILDAAAGYRRNIHAEACAAWVAANNIQPIPLDTKVRWPYKKELGVGVVTNNRPDGTATVSFASLGHKPGCGYVVEWEDLVVEPAAP